MLPRLLALIHRLTCRSCERIGGHYYHRVPHRIPWERFVRREF